MYKIFANNKLIYAPGFPAGSGYDLISPTISPEVGKAGSMTFTVPKSNNYYNNLTVLTTIIQVDRDEKTIWRGRILNADIDFNNNVQCTCEGALAFLNDSLYPPDTCDIRLSKFFAKIIQNHNDNVDSYKQLVAGAFTLQDVTISYNGSYTKTSDLLNSLLDSYGGYFVCRYTDKLTYIDWVSDLDVKSSTIIDFSENLLDLTKTVNAESIVTCLIPIGKDNLMLGSKYIENYGASALYGKIWATQEFTDIDDPDELLEAANEYLNNIIWSNMEVNVQAADISVAQNVDPLDIGNIYRIRSAPHNIDHEFILTGATIDITNPDNSSYTFNGTTIWTQLNLGKDLDEVTRAAGKLKTTTNESLTSRNASVESKTSGASTFSGDVEFSDGTKLTFTNGLLSGGTSSEGSF